ncbi:uncharacterized protein LOC135494021 [Lineus longissimus]|uniref:uncharacterized protein LOC135494021 n=1 Tax=Lineus longissimus TaxID=88925 RepID=UPI002B4D210B
MVMGTLEKQHSLFPASCLLVLGCGIIVIFSLMVTSAAESVIWGDVIMYTRSVSFKEFKVTTKVAEERRDGWAKVTYEFTKVRLPAKTHSLSFNSFSGYLKDNGYEVVYSIDLRGPGNIHEIGNRTLCMRNACVDSGLKSIYCRLLMNFKNAEPLTFVGEWRNRKKERRVWRMVYSLERPRACYSHHHLIVGHYSEEETRSPNEVSKQKSSMKKQNGLDRHSRQDIADETGRLYVLDLSDEFSHELVIIGSAFGRFSSSLRSKSEMLYVGKYLNIIIGWEFKAINMEPKTTYASVKAKSLVHCVVLSIRQADCWSVRYSIGKLGLFECRQFTRGPETTEHNQ